VLKVAAEHSVHPERLLTRMVDLKITAETADHVREMLYDRQSEHPWPMKRRNKSAQQKKKDPGESKVLRPD
jgi:hypothetical protein